MNPKNPERFLVNIQGATVRLLKTELKI